MSGHLPPLSARDKAASGLPAWRIMGVDFSSAPRRVKPIVVAHGQLQDGGLRLLGLEELPSLLDFERLLQRAGPWVAGFDLPFGLPRELVLALGWPDQWPALMRHYAALSRAQVREIFASFCAGRPPGGKFAHRACDRPAGSSPSMKWVNPPVAYMLHAGAPRLLQAGVHLPGLHPGDPCRVALEAYPGMLARELIGRASYKSDDLLRQTDERRQARVALLQALQQGSGRLGLQVRLDAALEPLLLDDPKADRLDALLCLVQAAWGLCRPGWGLPQGIDPLEGWIVSTPSV